MTDDTLRRHLTALYAGGTRNTPHARTAIANVPPARILAAVDQRATAEVARHHADARLCAERWAAVRNEISA